MTTLPAQLEDTRPNLLYIEKIRIYFCGCVNI